MTFLYGLYVVFLTTVEAAGKDRIMHNSDQTDKQTNYYSVYRCLVLLIESACDVVVIRIFENIVVITHPKNSCDSLAPLGSPAISLWRHVPPRQQPFSAPGA